MDVTRTAPGEWGVWTMADLSAWRGEQELYLEFLRVPAMNAGLYELAAGSKDPQSPHSQDEIYYVVAGKARFVAAGDETEVGPGTVLYVKADVEHRFVGIEESLQILVVFAG